MLTIVYVEMVTIDIESRRVSLGWFDLTENNDDVFCVFVRACFRSVSVVVALFPAGSTSSKNFMMPHS